MLTLEQVDNALTTIEKQMDADSCDIDKVRNELHAIRMWDLNNMRQMASIVNKLSVLESRLSNLAKQRGDGT